MVVTSAMLQKPDVVAYVGQNASRYGLDPAAVLAVANHEGLKTQPGTYWTVTGEPLPSFGPPSWYQGGAGSTIVQQQGSVDAAAHWSWTPAGLDYWMQSIANAGASGLTGLAAISKIVQNFERPRADLVQGEIGNAWHDYQDFQAQIANGPQGNTIVPVPGQIGPGDTQLPTPTNPQTKPAATDTAGAKFSLHLFDTPLGPINLTLPWDFSGILLFLAALLAIIIGALLWDKSRGVIVQTAQTGAMFA